MLIGSVGKPITWVYKMRIAKPSQRPRIMNQGNWGKAHVTDCYPPPPPRQQYKNRSESDPRSYKVTNKAQKKLRDSNGLSYFITARITFTSILYPQCTHMIFIIYTSCHSLHITVKIELALDLLPTRLHSSVDRASRRYRGGHGFE